MVRAWALEQMQTSSQAVAQQSLSGRVRLERLRVFEYLYARGMMGC